MSQKKIRAYKVITYTFIFYFTLNNAYAYLDPGTGSIILQVIAAILAAGLAFFSGLWAKIKALFKNLTSKKDSKKEEK